MDAQHSDDAEEVILQRCGDPWPHPAHDVPALGSRTGFRCAGALSEAEFERLLKPFGGPAMSRGPN